MLDLEKIILQINEMSSDRLNLYQDLKQRLILARRMLQNEQYDFMLLKAKASLAKTSWLVAEPTESLNFYSLPKLPETFQVVAVDGSQIVPDHHEIALCYLINTGAVLLSYGASFEPFMQSFPKLFYKEDELYQVVKGQKILIQGEALAFQRAKAEAEKLKEIVVIAKKRGLWSAALFDGTMIQWKLENNNSDANDWKNHLLETFLQSLDECKTKTTPVAGYISGSRSNDVVNLLRLGLCPEMAPNCDKCKYGFNPPCAQIEGITDINVFAGLLKGARTSVFYSSSKVLEKYGEHRIGFFYLNVGSEIARVEAPKWALENQQYLDFIHAVIFDQAQKGFGYPVVLSEAHELAVIKGKDREFFFNLLSKYYVQKGIPVEVTSKSLSKRRPIV